MCSATGRGRFAGRMLTGTLTKPKVTVPLQMGRPCARSCSSTCSSTSGMLGLQTAAQERLERLVGGRLRLGARELEHFARRLGFDQLQHAIAIRVAELR